MTWFRNLMVVFLCLPPLILLLMVVFLGIPTRDETGTSRKLIAAVRETIIVLTQSDSRPAWPLLQFSLSAAAVYFLILRALLVLPFVLLLLLHDKVTKGLSK